MELTSSSIQFLCLNYFASATEMLPCLHNYITVDTPAFLANPKNLEVIYNMCKKVCPCNSVLFEGLNFFSPCHKLLGKTWPGNTCKGFLEWSFWIKFPVSFSCCCINLLSVCSRFKFCSCSFISRWWLIHPHKRINSVMRQSCWKWQYFSVMAIWIRYCAVWFMVKCNVSVTVHFFI